MAKRYHGEVGRQYAEGEQIDAGMKAGEMRTVLSAHCAAFPLYLVKLKGYKIYEEPGKGEPV
jgi:hypothetical protein